MQRLPVLVAAAWIFAGCGPPETITELCPNGEAPRCSSDGKQVVRCDQGFDLIVLVCSDTEVCSKGQCRATVCPAGTGYCAGQVADQCDATGTQETRTDCAQVGQACVTDAKGAHCVTQSCTPGALTCSADGTQVMKCAPDGQSQALYQECNDPDLRGNQCINGVCVDRCALAEAAPRTTIGCRFVAASHAGGGILVANLQPDLAAKVTVTSPAGGTVVSTVAASAASEIAWPGGGPPQGTSDTQSGLIVTSTVPVQAWQVSQLGGAGDGSALFPEPNLGKVHYVPLDEAAGPALIEVVGTAANTHLTVTPNAAVAAGGTVPSLPAGQPATLIIARGEQVVLAGAAVGLCGSRVEADQPIAVFAAQSGQIWAEAPVLPWAALGRQYFGEHQIVVVAREDGTNVNGTLLDAGGSLSVFANLVEADKPVTALATDKSWIALAPAEQWLPTSVVACGGNCLLLATTNDATAQVDGAMVSGASAGNYWDFDALAGPAGTHTLVASRVGVLYSYALMPFYGLTGTFGLEPINP